jgi:hypothetical protein
MARQISGGRQEGLEQWFLGRIIPIRQTYQTKVEMLQKIIGKQAIQIEVLKKTKGSLGGQGSGGGSALGIGI